MNKKLPRFLFLLWFSIPIWQDSQAQKKENGLLWKISGNGLEKPSYLFGTMHIVCPEDLKLPAELMAALSSTHRTYLEMDLDDSAEMLGLATQLMMKDNIRLVDLITPAQYDSVKAIFRRSASQIPFVLAERYKPFLLSGLLAQEILNCGATSGMDMVILEETKKADRKVYGLETGAYQAAIFDSIPYSVQAKSLLRFIDSLDNYKSSLYRMLEAYRKGDLDELGEFMNESDPEMTDYSEIILYKRNENWVSDMPVIMTEAPTFFAVGAGHLPGDRGVLNLLRNAGYTVEPVIIGGAQ